MGYDVSMSFAAFSSSVRDDLRSGMGYDHCRALGVYSIYVRDDLRSGMGYDIDAFRFNIDPKVRDDLRSGMGYDSLDQPKQSMQKWSEMTSVPEWVMTRFR